MRIGFFVNPLAGYGGAINNKGSDNLKINNIEDSVSLKIAQTFLSKIDTGNLTFIVPSGYMGAFLMDKMRIKYEISYTSNYPSSMNDTAGYLKSLENVDLLCFIGGDGTARDVVSSGKDFLTLAIPAGVKMYSSVFSLNVNHAASLFNSIVSGHKYEAIYGDVNDIDEDEFRKGNLSAKLYGKLKIPLSDDIILNSKAEYSASSIYDIVEYIRDTMDMEIYYIIGPGTTCKEILKNMDIDTNLLGFDLIMGGKLLNTDMDEETIYKNMVSGRTKMIISPIGGQGFILGRGTKQISGRIIKGIGFDNIIVVSSEEKINNLKYLYIDIEADDIKIPRYIKVLTGYGHFKLKQLIE